MFSLNTKACSLKVMYIAGVIFMPVVIASSPASDDLANLRTIINAAADSISAMSNSSTGWNFFGGGNAGESQMGTADLVNNITTTILKSKFQLDTNKTSWVLPTETVDPANPQLNNTTWTPTLPLSSSLSLPSILPTSTPTFEPNTTQLSLPYVDYISSVSNLSASLISRGRTWHREMNAPVREAIEALQQCIPILQTSLLENELINSQAVIRTIRASSTLEDAKQAWSRFLNLPGSGVGSATPSITTRSVAKKRVVKPAFTPTVTGFYTHQELWGRDGATDLRQSSEYNAVLENGQRIKNKDGYLRPFAA